MEIKHDVLSQWPEIKGVFVGGCVERGEGSKFRAKAHSHMSGKFEGWICYRSTKWLHVKELALHELAHVITGEGHTDKWRKAVLLVGGTVKEVPGVLRSYEKRARGVKVANMRDLDKVMGW